MIRLLNLLTNLFPVWVLIGAALALALPEWFTWIQGKWIVWGLGVIMLGMGLTLTLDDFKRVGRMPRAVVTGVAAQFCLMPFLGWAIAYGFKLETSLAVGLILVACCPGGTASNVVTFLARANVALSVVMTMCSTFAAVALTPLLTKWLAGTLVRVDAWSLFVDVATVVIAPVLAGVALNHFAGRHVRKVLPICPLISVVVIALICAYVIARNAAAIRDQAAVLLTAVLLLHLFGFLLGYLIAGLLGYSELIRRTVSIEVGMQNSGLGMFLASNNFAATPMTSVPSAISAVFHSVIGSCLAAWWRLHPVTETKEAAPPAVPAKETVSLV